MARSEHLAAAVGIALVLLGVGLAFGAAPMWWVGLSCLAAGAVLVAPAARERLGPRLEPLRRPVRLGRWEVAPASLAPGFFCFAAILGVAIAMMPDVFGLSRLVSHDHPVHFFKAWQLRHELLPDGRIVGWSHRLFGGYPAGYLYPFGGDLWVAGIHLLTFGLLSMGQAYAVGIAAFWTLHGWAAYRFGERFAGRWVGLAAALLLMTNPGGFRYGGWKWALDFGVWPQSLALTFALLGLARLPGVVDGRRWQPVGAFGLAMGAALLTHPIVLLLFVPAAVVTLVHAWSRDRDRDGGGERPGPGAVGLRLGIGLGLGAMIAAAWWLPFLSTQPLAQTYGAFGPSFHELAVGLYETDLLPGTWGALLILGLLGTVPLLRAHGFRSQLVGWMTIVLLVASVSSVADELHLASLVASFEKIQYVRLLFLLKPFLFVAAVAAVAHLFRRPAGRNPEAAEDGEAAGAREGPRWRRALVAGLLALLVGPILVNVAIHFGTVRVDGVKTEKERKHRAHRRSVAEWLRRAPHEGPLERVAMMSREHQHDLLDLGVDLRRPIYKPGLVPAANYVYKPKSRAPSLLETLHVRYAVTGSKLKGKDWTLEARYGPYRIYRFERFVPEPFEVVEGEGEVRVVSFDDEEIVLRAEAGAEGRLRLDVSAFPRWKASRDGEPLEIATRPHPADRDRTGFMTVPLAPGEYRFTFERSAGDTLGLALAALAIVGGLLLLLLPLGARRWSLAARAVERLDALSDRCDRRPRADPWEGRVVPAVAVTAVASVLVATLALGAWTPAIELEGGKIRTFERARYDFLERLRDAEVTVVGKKKKCPRVLDRFVCADDPDHHVVSRPTSIEGYSTRRCIFAHPDKRGPMTITYPEVPVGDGIAGYYGVAWSGRGGSAPVDFRIDVDRETLLKATARRDTHAHWFYRELEQEHGETARVRFRIASPNTKKRHFCFYAQMVEGPRRGDRTKKDGKNKGGANKRGK